MEKVSGVINDELKLHTTVTADRGGSETKTNRKADVPLLTEDTSDIAECALTHKSMWAQLTMVVAYSKCRGLTQGMSQTHQM